MIKIYKKYLLLSVVAALFSSANINAQTKTFEKTYGGSANNLGNFIQQTSDGGYIMCGAKGNPGTIGYYDYSVIKIDAYGAVQWTQTLGDSANNEQAQCIRQTSDGGYIVYGSLSNSTDAAAWLVKLDADGNQQWSTQQQGSASQRYGYGLVVAPDGGYQTASYNGISADTNYFQLQKTDAAGNIQWGPKNILNGIGSSSSLALTKDGNYISVGTTTAAFDESTYNYYSLITLVKMNTSGSVIWTKSFESNPGYAAENYLQGFGVQSTADGGYIICGSTTINSHGGEDIFLLKTNSNGDSVWSKNYGGTANDVALSVKEMPGGGYVLTGNTRSYGAGSTDIFILKTDASGDSVWMKTYGGTGAETAGDIEITADSGFAVIGSSNSFGNGESDIYFLRTDFKGRIANTIYDGIDEVINTATFNVFPNPAADVLHVNYDVKLSSASYFVIYTTQGKELYREKLEAEKGLLDINVSKLASGLYFSGVETDGAFAETKMLVVTRR